MLVPYELTDGQTMLLEVSEAIGKLIADFRREDENYRRKMRRHNEVSLDALREDTAFEPIDPTADIEQHIIEQEEKDELKAAISQLSPKDNALITAIYYDEISAQDYAAQNGISFQSVYKRLFRAYGKIKKILSENG